MKIRTVLIVILLTVVGLKASWTFGTQEPVSGIPLNQEGNPNAPKIMNPCIATDDLGRVIVGLNSYEASTANFSVKIKSESGFGDYVMKNPNEAPIKFFKKENELFAFVLVKESSTKYPLYIKKWNSSLNSFVTVEKLGGKVSATSEADYIKLNDGTQYAVWSADRSTSTTQSKIVLKKNNGTGWQDSMVVCAKGRNPRLFYQNGKMVVYYLDTPGNNPAEYRLCKREMSTVLSDPILVTDEAVTKFELLESDNLLNFVYCQPSGVIKYAIMPNYIWQLKSFFIASNGVATPSFQLLKIANKLVVVKPDGFQLGIWQISADGNSGSNVGNVTISCDTQGALNIWLIDGNILHCLYVLFDVYRGNNIYSGNAYYSKIQNNDPNSISFMDDKTNVLLSNYPNPFNPATTISYDLKTTNLAKLTVYNAKGELVKELVNDRQNAGVHSVKFDGANLNSGVYYYKLETDGQSVVNKMLLVK